MILPQPEPDCEAEKSRELRFPRIGSGDKAFWGHPPSGEVYGRGPIGKGSVRLGEAGPFEIGGASLCQLFGRRPAISVGSNRYPTGLAAYVREPIGALRWRRKLPRNAGSSQQLRMAYYRGENRHSATDDLVCAHCDVFACAYRR